MLVAIKKLLNSGHAAFRGWTPWRWIALFMFEFVVVLLGVLAAQSLQQEMLNGQERDRARIALEEFATDKKDFAEFAIYYDLGYTCMRDYLALLREAAVERRPTDVSIVYIPQVWVTEWDNNTNLAVERTFGRRISQEHNAFNRASSRIYYNWQEALENWGVAGALQEPALVGNDAVQADVLAALGRLARISQLMRNTARSLQTQIDMDRYQVDVKKINGGLAAIPGCKARLRN